MANLKLYYLGGLGKPGRKITNVRSRGKIYTLPPAGEYLELPEFVANDLISRHKIRTKEGLFEAFTKDALIAKKVKEAGDLRAQYAGISKTLTIADVFKNFSREELAAALGELNQDASEDSGDEEDEFEDFDDDEPTVVTDGESEVTEEKAKSKPSPKPKAAGKSSGRGRPKASQTKSDNSEAGE